MMARKNLIIEQFHPEDLDNIFQQYLEQPLSSFFFTNLPTLFSREQLIFAISSPDSFFKIIRDQEEIKAVIQIELELDRARIRFLIKDNKADKDLTQACGDVLLDFLKDNLQIRKLSVALFPEETVATEILQELKFKQEGRLEQHIYLEGEYRDVVFWSVFREEFL